MLKELNVQDAIIATMFSGGQDLPLRTVVEMTIRLYENGYRIYGPEATGTAAPIYSAWHSAEDKCGGPFEGTSHQHAYTRESPAYAADQTRAFKAPDAS